MYTFTSSRYKPLHDDELPVSVTRFIVHGEYFYAPIVVKYRYIHWFHLAQYVQYIPSSSISTTANFLDVAVDPRDEVTKSGVDTGVSSASAAHTPRHNTDELAIRADDGAAAVSRA